MPTNTTFVTCIIFNLQSTIAVETYVDANAEPEHDTLVDKGKQEVRAPHNAERTGDDVEPACTILGHLDTGDTNQGLDAVPQTRGRSWGNRLDSAVEQPVTG